LLHAQLKPLTESRHQRYTAGYLVQCMTKHIG